MIKLWLLGKIGKRQVPDFVNEYNKLLQHDFVTFTHGRKYVFTKAEIMNMACDKCDNCIKLQMQIDAMNVKPTEKPDICVLVRDWVHKNYRFTSKRVMPRRLFFDHLNKFLSRYLIQMNTNRDKLWKHVVNDILKDRSTQFRHFKLIKLVR